MSAAHCRFCASPLLPIPVTQAQQREFYLSVADMSGGDAALRAESLLQSESMVETFSDGGVFLPLNCWAVKRYDPQLIEQRTAACDIRDDPIVGRTYRVKIFSKSSTTTRTLTRETTLKRKAANSIGAVLNDDASLVVPPTRASPLAIADGNPESESQSSSEPEPSSSSSSRHRHRRRSSKRHSKSKKAKKEKKEKKSSRPKKDPHIGSHTFLPICAQRCYGRVYRFVVAKAGGSTPLLLAAVAASAGA